MIYQTDHPILFSNWEPESNRVQPYLSVEAGRSGDEAGDNQGEDHELEEPHEQLARVRDHVDVERVQLVEPERQSQQNSW